MVITVDRVGELKISWSSLSLFAFESLWAFCFGIMLCHQPKNEIPELMFHLVPIFSSILFVITQAFHIFYSDQTELISVMSESKRIFDEEYHVKMFYTRKCFWRTMQNVFHKAMFFSDVSWKLFYMRMSGKCLPVIFYHNSFYQSKTDCSECYHSAVFAA